MHRQGEGAPASRIRRKGSLATTFHRSKGGQFIAHVKATPGNPYDGHTLATVLPEIEAQTGAPLIRVVAGRGYRGQNAPPDFKFKVILSGQSRRVTDTPRPSIEWAATSSKAPTATPLTPSSPPPAITSEGRWPGSPPFGASSSRQSSQRLNPPRAQTSLTYTLSPKHQSAFFTSD